MQTPSYEFETGLEDGVEVLKVVVKMPQVKGMSDLLLETDSNNIVLTDKNERYKLDLELPKPVIQSMTKASFRKKKKELAITMYTEGGGAVEGERLSGPAPLVRAKDSLEDLQKIKDAAPDTPPAAPNQPPPPPQAAAAKTKAKGSKKGKNKGNGSANAAAPVVSEAEKLKNEGNALLASGQLEAAVLAYTKAIECDDTNAIFFANRSSAYIKQESYGMAIADADKAIEIDPSYVKGYYRRGTAQLAAGHPEKALPDFREAVRRCPGSKEAKAHVKACLDIMNGDDSDEDEEDDEVTSPLAGGGAGASAYFRATYDPTKVPLEASYDGPHWEGCEVSGAVPPLDFVEASVEHMRGEKRLHKRYVVAVLLGVRDRLAEDKSLVDLDVAEGGRFTVCGDTHGQFYDLLNIFEINGNPTEDNPYLFNGDFVDRGSFSVEVALTLFIYKLRYPNAMFMTRGNHESRTCNAMYGFEGEVMAKYDRTVMNLFTEVFNQLPLAAVIDKKVLVVHGGLFDKDGVTLDDIRAIDRHCEPPVEGLMCDLLWADPKVLPGRAPSKRGVSCMFGPDVTKRFLDANGLTLLVRSHEVKPEGYEITHDGMCITVFSAPNYCDQMGNKGAFITFKGGEMEPHFTSFDCVPHPPIRPMAYQSSAFSMFGF